MKKSIFAAAGAVFISLGAAVFFLKVRVIA